MTVRELLHEAEKRLIAAGIGAAGTDACLLMGRALGETQARLPTRMREQVGETERAAFEVMVARRAAREPLAYILEDTEFMGLRFRCDPRAFVPRPDTEILVESVLDAVRACLGDVPPVIADIGTGTGCIAISLAHYLPQARVFATDLSPAALELARANAELNAVQHRVSLLQGEDLEPLFAADVAGQVLVLVSNPPYIPRHEVPDLDPEVSQAEPRLALDGGPDGLDFYRRVLPRLSRLHALRVVGFEFGYDQAAGVIALCQQYLPGWQLQVRQDLAGYDRAVVQTRDRHPTSPLPAAFAVGRGK